MDTLPNILIIMPDKHLGNFVISLVAIKALLEQCPSEKIAVVFDETYRELATVNLGSAHLIFYPYKQLKKAPFIKRCELFIDFVRSLRRFRPDVAIALESSNPEAVMSYLSGAKRRIAPNTNKSGLLKFLPFLFNEPIVLTPNKHRLQGYYDVMAVANLQKQPNRIQLVSSSEQQAAVDQLLLDCGIDITKPFVCMHTGAGKPHKQWATENFTQLAERLAAAGYQVGLIGSGGERDRNNTILANCPHKLYDLTERISLGQLSALFNRCSLMISNDSGPMHVAAMTGARVIVLFGPTDDVLWGPLSDKAIIVSNKDRRLESITVDQVFEYCTTKAAI